MFTNITASTAIQSVKKRQGKLNINNKNMKLIIDIIQFVCTTSTEITFNGCFYKQIKGLRMGSSLSPILADFVMEDILDKVFLTIDRPILIMKYVDDIMIADTNEKAQQIFQKLNEADPNSKIEIEYEKGNTINYLDFTIINQPFKTQTKWYQKHIASGRFLNYLSQHTKSIIMNTPLYKQWYTTSTQNSPMKS